MVRFWAGGWWCTQLMSDWSQRKPVWGVMAPSCRATAAFTSLKTEPGGLASMAGRFSRGMSSLCSSLARTPAWSGAVRVLAANVGPDT